MDIPAPAFPRAQHLLDWILALFCRSQLALSTVKKRRWFTVPWQGFSEPDFRERGGPVYILNSVDQGRYSSSAYYRPCFSMSL